MITTTITVARKVLVLIVALVLIFPPPLRAATTDFGFDFRSTAGFVTDPTYAAPVLGETSPHTYTNGLSNTISAGWVGTAPAKADENASNDPRLAGMQYIGNSGIVYAFRITLPVSGSWTIVAAFGDGNNDQHQFITMDDNGTGFASYSNTDTPINNFMDANGTVFTEANWITSNTALTHTFTSTTFNVNIGSASGSANSTIAHLRITQSIPSPNFTLGGKAVMGGKAVAQ
jgi:hypothetical protein